MYNAAVCCWFQTIDDQELFTDEELAQFEQEYEEKRREHFDGQVQPGEIHVNALLFVLGG